MGQFVRRMGEQRSTNTLSKVRSERYTKESFTLQRSRLSQCSDAHDDDDEGDDSIEKMIYWHISAGVG